MFALAEGLGEYILTFTFSTQFTLNCIHTEGMKHEPVIYNACFFVITMSLGGIVYWYEHCIMNKWCRYLPMYLYSNKD